MHTGAALPVGSRLFRVQAQGVGVMNPVPAGPFCGIHRKPTVGKVFAGIRRGTRAFAIFASELG
ncbi:hypothetical protein [Variovorax sp. WDL1]|nr:hypothetical protein [Variovorax sp. WDL1]KWT64445.1 hypothetical protein APY03_7623 [Variovorax sp. WDL1]